MMKLKICGLTKPEEAKWVTDAGADYAGIVMYYPKSKRNMEPAGARDIIKALGENTKAVAVVVSPTKQQVQEIEDCGFAIIQIHGDLPKEVLEALHIPFIRAFNGENYEEITKYEAIPNCKGFVFDAAEPGSGKTFDWDTLKAIPKTDKMFLLSGGLSVQNVENAMKSVLPDGVDVSSGVEYKDGRLGKDPDKIKLFSKIVKTFANGKK